MVDLPSGTSHAVAAVVAKITITATYGNGPTMVTCGCICLELGKLMDQIAPGLSDNLLP